MSLGTIDVVEAVNQVVRERLVAAGVVDDTITVNGSDGLSIGAGDQVVTRKNDSQRGIANRMTWTVHGVTDDGAVTLTHPDRTAVTVPADYVREHLHLAYATTGHGVQGQTSHHGRLRLTDSTDAAALYVGMTRGQHTNQVHIVADSRAQAREQWVAATNRDCGDQGLDLARKTALADAELYSVSTADDIEPAVLLTAQPPTNWQRATSTPHGETSPSAWPASATALPTKIHSPRPALIVIN